MLEKHALAYYPDIDYALVWLPKNECTPFVAAFDPVFDFDNNLDHWGQGHYFRTVEGAVEYIQDLKERRLKKCR